MAAEDSSDKKMNWTSSRLIERREEICGRFEMALRLWQQEGGTQPSAEEYLADVPEAYRWDILYCLLLLEEDYRRQAGEGDSIVREFRSRFPDFSSNIAQAFPIHGSPTATQIPASTANGLPKRVREYELREKIGQGGMGAVWKAWHIRLKRYRAIKVLHSHLLRSPEIRDRFLNEMEALARFEHPNIVRAHDAFEEGEDLYLVMEYIDGWDMSQLVNKHGRLAPGAACEVVYQAAQGLAALHDQHVTHRDIKPSNLMLATQPGSDKLVVKVMDLGLSQLDKERGLTNSGEVFGTCEFMAPEQYEDCRDLSPTADVYALGCSLHFLLTGQPPYKAEGSRGAQAVKLMLAHRGEAIPLLRESSPDADALQPLLNRMMAKKVDERYDSALELLEEIKRFADEEALRSVVEGKGDTVSGSVSTQDTAPDIDKGGRKKKLGRRVALGALALALLATLALIVPRVPVWLDPPDEVVVMPALSERHVTEELPHLTPAMRLYLKDRIASGQGSVGGVRLSYLGSLLKDGKLTEARDELAKIHAYLKDRDDINWLAYGGGVYEPLLKEFEAKTKAEVPVDGLCSELDAKLAAKGPFRSEGARLHLKAMLLQQGANAASEAAEAYYAAMEAYLAEGRRKLAGIAALEYAKLLVKQKLVGSGELHDPSAVLQHPEAYCDCRLFLAAAYSEAGRVHKLKGEYGDAIRKFDLALEGLGNPFAADSDTSTGDTDTVPLSNPLPGYALRWKAFTEMDRLRFHSAATGFEQLWRKPPMQAATLDNYLWGRQGEANSLHFAGKQFKASVKFQDLVAEIRGIDPDNPKHPGGGDTVLDSVAVDASKRRLPNIYERYADVFLYGRNGAPESSEFKHDFQEAGRLLSEAVTYCELFQIPQYHTFRIKYKRRVARLLKHLEESGPVPHDEFGPVLSPDEQQVKMEFEQELSYELERLLASSLEELCSGNDDEKAKAIDRLKTLFIRKGKDVDRKELGIRLVALEQIVLHGDLDPSALKELKARLETIAARMEKASDEDGKETSGYLTYYEQLLDAALAKTDATATG